eukprot:9416932-Pyramimonas_sp.AAC.1
MQVPPVGGSAVSTEALAVASELRAEAHDGPVREEGGQVRPPDCEAEGYGRSHGSDPVHAVWRS